MHSCISSFSSRVGPSKRKGSASPSLVARIAKDSLDGSKDTLLRRPHSCMSDCDCRMSLTISSFDVFRKNSLDMLKSSANLRSVAPFLCAGSWTSAKNMFQRLGPNTVPWNTIFCRMNMSDTSPSTATRADLGAR